MGARIKGIWQWRHLLHNLVVRDIRLRYGRALLGPLWLLLNPLLLVLLYTFVFSLVLKVGIKNYPLFLLSGLLPWLWFASTMSLSVSSLSRDSNLLRKASFPAELLVLRSVIVAAIDLFVALFLLLISVSFWGGGISRAIVALPLLLLLQALLMAGLALPLSMLGAVSRDFDHIVANGIRLLFFATPIAYSLDSVPASLRNLVLLNPMALLMQSYQAVLIGRQLPQVIPMAQLFCGALLIFVIGWSFFYKRANLLPEVV